MNRRNRNKRNVKRYVYIRDRGKCYFCGEFVKFNELSLDHIFPRSLGGPNIRENLRVSHQKCNEKRANDIKNYSLLPIFGPKHIKNVDIPGFSR